MKRARYDFVDTLRGLAILAVIVYHFIYDLIHFYSMDFPWFDSIAVYIIQQVGAGLFVFIAGAMWLCAKGPVRNGLVLVGYGLMITLITYIYSPGSIIVFGILSLLGSAALLTAFLDPLLRKIPAKLGLVLALFLFFLTHDIADGRISLLGNAIYEIPFSWYGSGFLFPLGFPHYTFVSADYFPLLPWIFPYWLGYFSWQLLDEDFRNKYLCKGLPLFSMLGRHSLAIYFLHQPVLLLICFLIFGNN